MFRRLSNTLPKDPVFPADLEKLGYQINEKDQLRSIAHPHQEFHFYISKNERVLEMQREAFDICIRRELSSRFQASGLTTTRLPLNASPTDPHIPILTTPNISTASRLILYIGESTQDLGVFAYRVIGQESISSGSALDFVHAIRSSPDSDSTAIVIANPGQLIWYRRGQRAMTLQSWSTLPRKTGVSNQMRIDAVKNHVPGNYDAKEHVESVFEAVAEVAREDVKIDVIGVSEGAEYAIKYLEREWEEWKGKVQAIAVGLGFVWRVGEEVENQKFMEFWGRRARAYLIHPDPLDTPLYGREDIGCNCYSSGEDTFTERIMPRAYKSILAFFQMVNDIPGYYEAEMWVPKDENDLSRVVRWDDGTEVTRAESPAAA